jgi:hypothetical protein
MMSENMRKYLLVATIVGGCLVIPVRHVMALSGVGAKVSRISDGQQLSFSIKTSPNATITIIDDEDSVYSSVIDEGSGIASFAVNIPEVKRNSLRIFSTDGVGLTEKITVNGGTTTIAMLLPPTIYHNIGETPTYDSLGFIGYTFPNAQVIVSLSSSINENKLLETLANSSGEWQVETPVLSPGKYQAKAQAVAGPEVSAWSQIMEFEVLNPSDRAVSDLGAGTRDIIEKFTGTLPEPAQEAVKTAEKQADFISKVVVPAALTIGSLAQIGILLRNVSYLLLQALIAIGQMFGFVKKRQQWGVIYDSITKKPLTRAIVRLYQATTKKLIETDVSNKSGIFSFLPQPGDYYIEASKPGYVFPSQLVRGKVDGEYQHVYAGGQLEVKTSHSAIDVAIPLDPEQYEENYKMKWQKFYGRYIDPFNNYILGFGALLAVMAFARKSNTTNFVVLWLYIFGLGFQAYRSLKIKREWGVIMDDQGNPYPGLEITLTDIEFNRLVSRRISDVRGRYQFVAPPGKYLIKVVNPEAELLTRVHGAYQGQELIVEGRQGAEALLTPKIVVKKLKVPGSK